MNSALERLLSLRVGDVMSKNVVRIPHNDTMAAAAEVLDRNDVSGAPVVDEEGRCMGVISNSDFVLRTTRSAAIADDVKEVFVQDAPGEAYHLESINQDQVRHHMTDFVESISPDTSILDAARAMCKEHIHRLVVLDAKKRPVGLVSSLDLVAAMVSAIEE
ncbi:MAG: CBS domain-containing protein [Pirellulales bacterium]|nr:CBS domain-containing protein [Pirellulales bacterium]